VSLESFVDHVAGKRRVAVDDQVCPICGLDGCEREDHRPPTAEDDGLGSARQRPTHGAYADFLLDASLVAAEGERIAREGVPYAVEGLVPAIGSVGMHVAFTRVGKTTETHAIGAAVACGTPFLERATRQARVLFLAPEDPPEYTAFLFRHHRLDAGAATFYRGPLQFDAQGLAFVADQVRVGGYGLVLCSSWQAVVASLVKDENDNAGAIRVVESVKAVARTLAVPFLIDAHSGKGEDQGEDADPSKAMRGASGAIGAADYVLSLRYANGPFGSRRRLSGKGKFVNFPPLLIDYNATDGLYTVLGDEKTAMIETTWRLIVEMKALTTTPQPAAAIARTIGLLSEKGNVTGSGRRQVQDALRNRQNVRTIIERHGEQSVTLYALLEAE
jgi:hypothetical protein